MDRIENLILDFEAWQAAPEPGYNLLEAFASEFLDFREQILACLNYALEKESQCCDLLTHQALLRAHLETGLNHIESALDRLADGEPEEAYERLRLGGDHLAEALRMVEQHNPSPEWLRPAA